VDKVKSWTDKVIVDFEWFLRICDGHRISRPSPPPSSARAPGTTPQSIDRQHQDTSNLDINDTALSECVIFMTRKASVSLFFDLDFYRFSDLHIFNVSFTRIQSF
jgi:hypothetical protein